jgi:hypothetical protein
MLLLKLIIVQLVKILFACNCRTWLIVHGSSLMDRILWHFSSLPVFVILFASCHRYSGPPSGLSFHNFRLNFVCVADISHACYISFHSHPVWFIHSNNIGEEHIYILKILIARSSSSLLGLKMYIALFSNNRFSQMFRNTFEPEGYLNDV